MRNDLSLHRITSCDDPLLPPWLDCYQKKFPLAEQVLISTFLSELAAGEESNLRMAAILNGAEFAGILCYELQTDARAAYLWYIAAEPEGQGIGAWAYNKLGELVRDEAPDATAIVYEVERPEDAHDEVSRLNARRRIAFYTRLGAKLFPEIEYLQDVEWQPPMPMYLMLQPIGELLSADDEIGILRAVFAAGLKQEQNRDA